jgi:hypothetical protein
LFITDQREEERVNTKSIFIIGMLACLCFVGCGPEEITRRPATSSIAAVSKPRETIRVGDSLSQVEKTLGDASIEFPDGDNMIHWYAGYQVTTSNRIVIAVAAMRTDT